MRRADGQHATQSRQSFIALRVRKATSSALMRAAVPRAARFAAVLVLLLAGCTDGVSHNYGQRHGSDSASVNGTGVLARLFEGQGHKVRTWRHLSPRLERAQTIVWFPNNYSPPTPEVESWLIEWLKRVPGRTLIYVGRDFDAEPGYWRSIRDQVSKSQRREVQRRELEAVARVTMERAEHQSATEGTWFSYEPAPPRTVKSFDANEHFPAIDPAKAAITLGTRMGPAEGAEALLVSQGDVLVARQEVDKSQLILVANGSFLLNLPLVNHEHRKLAIALVKMTAPDAPVIFLESDESGPLIYQNDPPTETTHYDLFGAWPISLVLAHLAVLGLVLAVSRYPIFGIPREVKTTATADFGEHIAAVGKLLEQTGDVQYATERWQQYVASPSAARSARSEPPPGSSDEVGAKPASAFSSPFRGVSPAAPGPAPTDINPQRGPADDSTQ